MAQPSRAMAGTMGLTLLLLMVPAAQSFLEDYFVPTCSAGNHLADMNTPPDLYARILVDYEIGCDGRISSWEIFPSAAGEVYLTVWRIDHVNDKMRMVGFNRVTITVAGFQEFEIDQPDRIPVRPGDKIGYHYEDASSDAVFSFEDPGETATFDSTTTVRGLVIADTYADTLTTNTLFDYDSKAETVFESPIKAQVSHVTTNLRLQDGKNFNEGRPDMFLDDIWGTLCDKWFENLGWPLVFCLESGFPYGDDVTAEYKYSPPDLPFHKQSPKCKTSEDVSMFSCWEHAKGECDKSLGFYVVCPKRVKLEPIDGNHGDNEGVAYMYDGFWGPVCDRKAPDDYDKDPKPHTWFQAFCRELGYATVVDYMYATDYDAGYSTTDRPARRNPKCNINNPKDMSYCPSDPYVLACTSELAYFVSCQGKLGEGGNEGGNGNNAGGNGNNAGGNGNN